ncbi:Piwi domain-containing protein [Kalaharituber pfeilii]|nr:Piwi domain-containing protein [Kalaharituber pfeilii]
MNHLISQSLRLDPDNVCLKRSFFRHNAESYSLDGGLVVKKGLFMSVRGGHNKLTINVDVATAVFWPSGKLLQLMQKYLRQQGDEASFTSWMANQLKVNEKRFLNELKRFRRISFYTTHTAPQRPAREQKHYIIDGFTEQGANNTFFLRRITKADGSVTEKKVSVANFFSETYKIRLQYPNLPCVKTKGNREVPLELCHVSDTDNRCLFKLDDRQTSSMIKINATRPAERRRAIGNNVDACKWGQDPVLQAYGMEIQPTMMKVKARILPAPELMFGAGGQIKSVPGNMAASGQWNLQGKQFAKTSTLKSFGCLIFANQQQCPLEAAKRFIRSLMNSYSQHGGVIENNNPIVQYVTPSKSNIQKSIREFWTQVGNQMKMRPQILFFIIPFKTSMPYNEIKHFCETELGCVSQCVLVAHVLKCAPQYLSNVCMKLNAKIGGTTCYLNQANNPLQGRGYNLMIGADVSHAAPGSEKPSFASMVGSTDLHGTRYSGIVGTNGIRQEMISEDNMKNFLTTMIFNFKKNTNFLPNRIFYFRDGVSEQQYHHVLEEEVKIMKKICKGLNATWAPKFTVTVCSKRHHHRFFPGNPRDGDKNGNVLPGTIIEKDVTDPAEYDFYLNSHKAIQGTARPTHYYVIMDETGIPVDDFQAICNNMCYTYIRSTTAVSMIPPVYYAHLASLRGRCHESTQSITPPATSVSEGVTIRPLHDKIKDAMWYV